MHARNVFTLHRVTAVLWAKFQNDCTTDMEVQASRAEPNRVRIEAWKHCLAAGPLMARDGKLADEGIALWTWDYFY